MARKKVTIQTHFNYLEVSPIPDQPGFGIFDTSDLNPNKSYQVLVTTQHVYGDGTQEPVFFIQGEDDRIVEKACNRFKVASVE